MADHPGLPVHGYTLQPQAKIDLANEGKQLEETVLRYLDKLDAVQGAGRDVAIDKRWVALGRTHVQQGFMAAIRAIFQPQRINGPLALESVANLAGKHE